VPKGKTKKADAAVSERAAALNLPQENILYFLEKSAPRLAPWQREILRITRVLAQYFYPQTQTKVMNEGTACYVHYRIMTALHDQGDITEGAFLEFLTSHTNVVSQPMFDSGHYGGLNPYWVGYNMMQDIARICVSPTEEDSVWFPDIAGGGDVEGTLKHIWANYRDESFVSQFLSPRLMRSWRLFKLADNEKVDHLKVDAIHDERGYRELRRSLARLYDISWQEPDIQIVDVDLAGDRKLALEHYVTNGVLLSEKDADRVVQHLADLWGYEVVLNEVDNETRSSLKEHKARPRANGPRLAEN
jgi:spore cortex formation protein SpoVR/YcgB (stage V sporulation)